MSATRYVVHVGPHKTGTTALQRAFARHRATLAARQVIVPEGWDDSDANPSHTGLLRALAADDPGLAARFDRWNTATPPPTVLISCEELKDAAEPILRRLAALIGGRPVTIVFMIRRQAERLVSGWHERIAQGDSVSLPEWLLGHLRNPEHSALLNVAFQLEPLARIFGRDSLALVSVSTLVDRGLDLFTHFAAAFLAWPDAPEGGRANVTAWTPERAELLRALNTLPWPAERGPLSLALPSQADTPLLAQLEDAIRGHVTVVRLGDALPGLRALNADLFQRYASHLVPPRLPAKLVEPRVIEAAYARADWLVAPGITDWLLRLHAALAGSVARPC